MNAKQALRFVTKLNAELEDYKAKATKDITAYNLAILSHIEGGSLCEWCNDYPECNKHEKDVDKACKDWMLTYDEEILNSTDDNGPVKIEFAGGNADESEGLLPASAKSRE